MRLKRILTTTFLASILTLGMGLFVANNDKTEAKPVEAAATPSTTRAFFTNGNNWGTVKCHYWGTSASDWPGENMTKYSTNAFGQDIYYFNVPSGTTGVVFNNGSGTQTVDIDFSASLAYYPNGTQGGKVAVGTFSTHTVSLSVNTASYGAISPTANFTVPDGQSYSVSSNKLIIGADEITPTPTSQTAQYSYSFNNWTVSGAATTSGSIDGDKAFVANFTRNTRTYTVSFNMLGHGAAPSNQTIAYGGKVTKPSDPAASGYSFGGWYKEAACTNAWNFSTDTITAATTIYAKWTVLNRTITKRAVKDGVLQAGNIGTDNVVDGSTYDVPKGVLIDNYSFGGWYTNEACTIAYTSRTISADLTIYGKYTTHGPWSGSVSVDLLNSGWADASANYAIMFMNKTTYASEVDGWSNYVTNVSAGVRLINFSYSLSFEPFAMTIGRFNTSAEEPDWDDMWNQTDDIDVTDMVRISNVKTLSKNDSYSGFPKVMGGDPWAEKGFLNSVKLNGSNNAEYYGNVTLAQWEKFNILKAPYADGDYSSFTNCSFHSSLEGRFQNGGSGSIQDKVGGTYSVYFDSFNNTIYITTVAAAAADEWAQYFTAHVGCDPTGASLPSGWSACATEYAKLSNDAKDIVFGATARIDGGYVEKAVYWYDYAVRAHPSLTRFIVNSSSSPRTVTANTSAILSRISMNSSNATIIVVVVSMIGVASLAGYYFFKKRKHESD